MIAFVFPGQGSQFLGMGQDTLIEHPELELYLRKAQDTIGVDLKELIFGEDAEKLTLSQNAQASILTITYIKYLAHKKETGEEPEILAGHSLGEWTALVIADVLDFETALRCVYARGLYMNEACPPGLGTMAAVMGLPLEIIEDILQGYRNVLIANDNGQQVVISGATDEVGEVMEHLKRAGARKVIPLQVSGPFHSPLIAGAQARMQEHLMKIPFRSPRLPIVQNVTAQMETDALTIKKNMVRQITWPVRWRESIYTMQDQGVETIREIGPKAILTPINKKIMREQRQMAL